ncbi:phage tail protein [Citrobacter freundii]|uniref:gp53-like domain-containing protein n=2 Tax=Citrobacter freundii TaxID=546 RepID=UPI00292B8E8A|nr:phage tail protein [Citrobacter freundii]MEB0335784.1 phage tail protein [Citrobacter freundii]
MATNNFKPFATAANANVTAQADWEALPALLSGFMAGKASSAQVNKAIRQASFIAAALAQYTANKSGLDVLDDGDLNGFISKMGTAFGKDFQALDATLTALAGLATGANKLPYFTGNDTAALTDLTQVGRDIIGKSTIADILTYLGLGEAAKRNVGTGANQIPDMSAYSSGSGWQKLPDGSIEQWGRINFPTNAAAVSTNVTFPIPFTQDPDVVIVYDGGFGGGNMWGATNWTRTGFVAHCNYGFEGGAFFAKGR